MVRELAVPQLEAGTGAAFEAAFAGVALLLAAADGYRGHRLVAALDQPDTYLLEVDWRDLAAHVERFEPSVAHARFMACLDPFLKDEPRVLDVPGGDPDASGLV